MARAADRPALHRSLASAWRRSPALRWGALAVLLTGYAFASLEPFDWEVPRQVPNRAERVAEGWRFAAPGIVIAKPPHTWLEAASAAEMLEIALVIRPLSATQSGPARILTMSRDAHMRNLTLAQEDDDLVLRLRTADTDLNGLLGGEPFARVHDVFDGAGWVAIDLRIRPRQLTITVDGRPALAAALPPAVVRTWHASFDLALGNETTCDRPWLGEIRTAALRAPGRERDYADADAVRLPASCWAMEHAPVLVPLRLFLVEDVIRNTLMYVPLGVLLGLMMLNSSRHATLFGGLLLVLGVSTTFEIAQLFVASRFPSADDVLFNAIGGGVGLACALLLPRLAGRRA